MRLSAALLLIALTTCLGAVAPEGQSQQKTPDGDSGKTIPFDQLGVEAQKQYSGGGIAITPTTSGAQLRTVFQKLEGHATPEGLWLTSTREEDADKVERFRVLAAEVGRHQEHLDHHVRLPGKGTVKATSEAATFVRAGLSEEYRVSMDGVRQDFIVMERPAGEGALSIVLEVTGAHASAASYGAKLTLAGSGREIAYSRLHVTDATGRELTATLEVLSPGRLEVRVDDASATYPVRIDPTFSDANWVSVNPGIPGANDTVRAAVVDGSGNLYIGGDFNFAGTVAANRIAKWNGSAWSALGSGMDSAVFALAVIGSNLYAGGEFSTAGGVSANYLAKWNGNAWSALGTGVDGYVHAFAVSGTDLYVGGEFYSAGGVEAHGIAKWNGSVWSALGTGMDYSVRALAVIGNDLYAGGQFYSVGGAEANHIAKWNGSGWSALGTGMNSVVFALAVSGTDLYAGGQFTMAGGVEANRIAKWNGSEWSALPGQGLEGDVVNALAIIGTNLYAAGQFTAADGVTANSIAKWNGSEWSVLGTGVDDTVNTLAVSGTDLYVGGRFRAASGMADSHIAKWNGSAWSALGIGMDQPVFALAMSGTDLYVGGSFTAAGGVPANYIVKWNGSAWSALGTGMDGPVAALAVSGSDLYAGGGFTTAGGVSANCVAKWNGSTWSALGTGINNYGSVRALAVNGSNVYVGGVFNSAGGVAASSIAKWNGSAWSALGTGIKWSIYNGNVFALAVIGSDLYVGGSFTTAGGGGADNIAKWDGSEWSALGTGMDSGVSALVVSGTDLYAGGSFTTAGGVIANCIAKWNGNAWSALGTGMNSYVHALAVSGSDLYAGGYLTTAGGVIANCVAKWNGSAWSALGTGMDQPVNALAADAAGHLYLGGQFFYAGTTLSPFIARADLPIPTVTTSAVSNLLPTSVTLNGSVNPNGLTTTARFEYGLTTSYDSNASVALSPNNGITAQPVSATLSGLLPGTLYHYRLSATNAGTATTTDGTFTTLTVNTPQEIWRQLHFGSTGNTGNAADSFDFDKDGLINLIEFALGLNPKLSDTSQLPTAQKIGSNFVMSFTQPAGVAGITYGAEWSATLLANDWHSVADSGTGGQHIFSVPVGSNTKLFMRLVITSP